MQLSAQWTPARVRLPAAFERLVQCVLRESGFIQVDLADVALGRHHDEMIGFRSVLQFLVVSRQRKTGIERGFEVTSVVDRQIMFHGQFQKLGDIAHGRVADRQEQQFSPDVECSG
jgi:hypothetical protein